MCFSASVRRLYAVFLVCQHLGGICGVMHGLAGYIIIACCICTAIAGFVVLAIDMRKSRRGARRRQKLVSRILPK